MSQVGEDAKTFIMSSLKIKSDRSQSYINCSSFKQFLELAAPYTVSAESLKSKACVTITKSRPCLYIKQEEYAIISKNDPIFKEMGSDMSTTCHMIVFQTKDKSLTALGHFDGYATQKVMDEIILKMTENLDNKELDIHIIGGFEDDKNTSFDLTAEIINELINYGTRQNTQDTHLHLKTFCCTHLNTITKTRDDVTESHPAILGIVAHCETGKITPAKFNDAAMGPACALRGAKLYSEKREFRNIYNFPNAFSWLQQTDEFIKEYMSTSPAQEPDNFVHHVRQTLAFILSNPDSSKVFSGKDILCFKPKQINGVIEWILKSDEIS